MINSRRQLEEKMTLFWHCLFATAFSKSNNARLSKLQVDMFRRNCLGDFKTLLVELSKDPAMIFWLDNQENTNAVHNENYGRELLELFSMGIGNYTEDDVKACARAFTGWGFSHMVKNGPHGRINWEFKFHPELHDYDEKTFLGETKNWDADDVLATLVRHPATARFLTTKLFRFFVYDNPSQGSIDRLAATYTSSGFDIRAVMRDILTGPEFLSPAADHGQVKQPVELVIGTLKALDVQSTGPDLPRVTRQMGQDLLNPPDVSGWKGGDGWISSATLLERFNFADRLLSAREIDQPYFVDVGAQLRSRNLQSAADVVDYYLGVLVDGHATPEARQALVDYLNASGGPTEDGVRGLLHLTLSLPGYQLA
jgi:uncharacterized protein (DUF1800 family)